LVPHCDVLTVPAAAELDEPPAGVEDDPPAAVLLLLLLLQPAASRAGAAASMRVLRVRCARSAGMCILINSPSGRR
jgi:hypothetical protein